MVKDPQRKMDKLCRAGGRLPKAGVQVGVVALGLFQGLEDELSEYSKNFKLIPGRCFLEQRFSKLTAH